jgi:hypothetical protein
MSQRDRGDRGRVGPVGLAGAAGAEQPRSGGQLGGHVNHELAGAEQPLRHGVPQPARALHRHRRAGHRPAQASSWATVWSVMATRRVPSGWLWASSATAVTDRLCGSMPMVITDGLSSRDGGPRRAV